MYNKGFTLIETLLVLIISSILLYSGLKLKALNAVNPTELFESTVIHTQYLSLFKHSYQSMDDYSITFNEIGHINEGKTLKINTVEVVLQLVTGRIYEKGQYLD